MTTETAERRDGEGRIRGWERWWSGQLLRLDADRAFVAAYATTLAGIAVSGGLTYLYVGPGVRELNPVTGGLIARFGPGGMVAARFLVVVATFWGYHLLRGYWPALTVAFAWIGALIHLVDAVHDARIALLAAAAGFDPVGDVAACLVVLAAGTAAGILLRPPASPDSTDGIARLRLREGD